MIALGLSLVASERHCRVQIFTLRSAMREAIRAASACAIFLIIRMDSALAASSPSLSSFLLKCWDCVQGDVLLRFGFFNTSPRQKAPRPASVVFATFSVMSLFRPVSCEKIAELSIERLVKSSESYGCVDSTLPDPSTRLNRCIMPLFRLVRGLNVSFFVVT